MHFRSRSFCCPAPDNLLPSFLIDGALSTLKFINADERRARTRAAEIRGVIAFLIAKGKKVNFHFYLSLTLASLNRKKVGKIIRGIFFCSPSSRSPRQAERSKTSQRVESKFPFSSISLSLSRSRETTPRRRRKK